MKYVYYYDSHQAGMNDDVALKQIKPILTPSDSVAVIPRPGYPSEVVVLSAE